MKQMQMGKNYDVVVVGLKRLSASIYSVGEIPVIGNEGEILW
jgi:hypothetical protein